MSSILVSTGVLPQALQPHVIRELEASGVTVFKDRTDPYIKVVGANGQLVEIYLSDVLGRGVAVPIKRGEI
jgi:hypothetical protein